MNDLVRPRQPALEAHEREALAGLMVERLLELWGGRNRSRRPYPCDIELTALGLTAGNATVVEACATDAVAGLDGQFQYRLAADLGGQAIGLLEAQGAAIPLDLLRRTGEACVRVGEVDRARAFYRSGLEQLEALRAGGEKIDPMTEATLLVAHARLLVQRGEPEKAMGHFERAAELAREAGSERDAAVTLGDIANLKAAKGEVDEALRLLKEILVLFERLGDVHRPPSLILSPSYSSPWICAISCSTPWAVSCRPSLRTPSSEVRSTARPCSF